MTKGPKFIDEILNTVKNSSPYPKNISHTDRQNQKPDGHHRRHLNRRAILSVCLLLTLCGCNGISSSAPSNSNASPADTQPPAEKSTAAVEATVAPAETTVPTATVHPTDKPTATATPNSGLPFSRYGRITGIHTGGMFRFFVGWQLVHRQR